jgi:hypothetical protein
VDALELARPTRDLVHAVELTGWREGARPTRSLSE